MHGADKTGDGEGEGEAGMHGVNCKVLNRGRSGFGWTVRLCNYTIVGIQSATCRQMIALPLTLLPHLTTAAVDPPGRPPYLPFPMVVHALH